MALFDFCCDQCGEELEDVYQPVNPTNETCPNCGCIMRRKFGRFTTVGTFHWMGDKGKEDKIVSYPGGHTRRKTHNELYREGGI